MPRINYGRFVLGALAAGVVANVLDFIVNGFLMAEDLERMAQRLGLSPAVTASTSTAITWVIVDFVYAALIVWTYVGIRPRLGPGPMTAVIAAFVIYASATSILFGFQSMGMFTFDTFLKSAIFSLGVSILSGLAGAAIYRED